MKSVCEPSEVDGLTTKNKSNSVWHDESMNTVTSRKAQPSPFFEENCSILENFEENLVDLS